MKHDESELHALLQKFESLLQEYPDEASSFFIFKNYLKILLRVKTTNCLLPTSELITIIKHQKPYLFSLLKKESADITYLYFLPTTEMGYYHAKRKLSQLKDQLGYHTLDIK